MAAETWAERFELMFRVRLEEFRVKCRAIGIDADPIIERAHAAGAATRATTGFYEDAFWRSAMAEWTEATYA